MSPITKDPILLLIQIFESLQKIETYTCEGKYAFLESSLIQDAVYRNLEIIGEAAGRLPLPFRATLPSIPWKSIIGLRNILIHQYEGIDPEEIWMIVDDNIPALKATLREFFIQHAADRVPDCLLK
jgi:uncharacterized protein with HEPN domain